MMSIPTLFRTYGANSKVEYSKYIKNASLEHCEEILNRTNGLDNQ